MTLSGRGSRRFTAEQIDEMATLYKEMVSMEEIARRMGCAQPNVRYLLKREGVWEPRSGGRRQYTLTDEQVLALHERGLSQTAIAEELGVSQTWVSRRLCRYGITQTGRHWENKNGRLQREPGDYVSVVVTDDDPIALAMGHRGGYVKEHRLVMAHALGRPLDKTETVHHINGIRDDNRLENLQLRQGLHGKGAVMICGDCGSHNVISTAIAD